MVRLYDALSPHLYGFLVGLTGRRDLAEDLLQQTFLRALERLAARRPGNVKAWLTGQPTWRRGIIFGSPGCPDWSALLRQIGGRDTPVPVADLDRGGEGGC